VWYNCRECDKPLALKVKFNLVRGNNKVNYLLLCVKRARERKIELNDEIKRPFASNIREIKKENARERCKKGQRLLLSIITPEWSLLCVCVIHESFNLCRRGHRTHEKVLLHHDVHMYITVISSCNDEFSSTSRGGMRLISDVESLH
jgi:hypothetical protein